MGLASIWFLLYVCERPSNAKGAVEVLQRTLSLVGLVQAKFLTTRNTQYGSARAGYGMQSLAAGETIAL